MLSIPKHELLFRQSHQLELRREPVTSVSDSAVVIRMKAAGLCGTDIAMLRGTRACGAEVLGHEGVGVVLSAPKQSGLSEGSRVIVNPVHHSRPECVIGHSRDGVFRELFWLDSSEVAQGGFLVECPTDCPVECTELALAEPVASVVYSLALLRGQKTSSSLLIRGSGTIAILAAKLWSTDGGSTAVIVSKSEAHARWLREATHMPPNVTILNIEANGGIVSNTIFDSAILCCSREDARDGFRFLMDNAHDGATIDLMAGFPADFRETRLSGVELDRIRWNNICGIQSAPPTRVRDEKTGKTFNLVGHRGTSERQILQAVNLLSQRTVSLADIPHETVALEELPTAVLDVLSPARHKNKWVKAMITFPQNGLGDLDGHH